jgi:hypothetical protein
VKLLGFAIRTLVQVESVKGRDVTGLYKCWEQLENVVLWLGKPFVRKFHSVFPGQFLLLVAIT